MFMELSLKSDLCMCKLSTGPQKSFELVSSFRSVLSDYGFYLALVLRLLLPVLSMNLMNMWVVVLFRVYNKNGGMEIKIANSFQNTFFCTMVIF